MARPNSDEPIEMPITTLGIDVSDIHGEAFVNIVAGDLQILASGMSPTHGGEELYEASTASKDMVRTILDLSGSEESMMGRNSKHYTEAERARRKHTQGVFAGRLVSALVEGFDLPWQRIADSNVDQRSGEANG